MRQAMEPVVHPEDLGSITTKSWRQVGPTWAALTDLNATDLCALANWQEKGEVKEATPLRYHRAKTLHAQALKLCLRDAVGIMKANAGASWQEVSPAELRRQFPLTFEKPPKALGSVTSSWVALERFSVLISQCVSAKHGTKKMVCFTVLQGCDVLISLDL